MDSRKVTTTVLGTVIKIAIAAVVVFAVYKLAIFAYDFGYRVFAEPAVDAAPGTEVTVTIEEGQSPGNIGKMLEAKGLIESSTLFTVQELLSEHKDGIQPGVYTLNTAQTAEEMLAVMSEVKEETEETKESKEIKETEEEITEANTEETGQ